jgi:hypothetical protein
MPEPAARPAPVAAAPTARAAFERELKCASITIRLSQDECAQLRQRAAEAGLTVSAYLRSCTFEAESLRAMVKDTLAQLRAATTAGKPVVAEKPREPQVRSLASRLARLANPWHAAPRVANA